MKVMHQLPAPTTRPAFWGNWTGRLLGWALALGALPAAAQVPRLGQALPQDTVRHVVDLPAATLDSLAAEPLAEPVVDSARLAWLQTPATLQELVGDRMSCFETTAPHQFNAAVMAYVRLFTERQRGYTQRVLERQDFYFPLFEKYLAQYHLPAELKYLSVVESALIPTAKSQVGAVGLWQFMPPTANDWRLKRDEWVDERMHPEKATEAACKHLRYLYGVFHDWELVLAAYNWGAGNMQRVIRKTGKRNFWELYPHLPAETRNYVPTFTAIMYAMTYAQQHELHSPALHYQRYEPLDTLGLRGQAVDLRRLSRALGYTDSLALIRFNPELRYPSLPAGYRPYVLRYPAAAREHLGDVDRATLLAYCQPTADLPPLLAALPPRLAGVEPWPSKGQLAGGPAPRPDSEAVAPRTRRVSHTLRRGQTLATVADKYAVSTTQLRRWNNLRKNQPLKPGRELVVLVALPPAAPRERSAALATVAAPPTSVATLRHTAPTDSAWLTLKAANARYAQLAQERAARELAQAQQLARTQRQLAARAAAQQRLSIAQAAAAAKASAGARLGLPAEPTDSAATLDVAVVAPAVPEQPVARRRNSARVRPEVIATETPATEAEPLAPEPQPTAASRRTARLAAAAAADLRPAGSAEGRRAREEKPALAAKTYTVQVGDNLTHLARDYSLSMEQLKAWNKLKTETLVAGQTLRLTAPAETAAPAATEAAPASTSVAAARRPAARPSSPRLETHTVQPGDTLFNISKRFGVSVEELRRLNHLASDQVKLGQKLVVQAG